MKYTLETLSVGQLSYAEVAEFATRIVTDHGTLPPAGPRTDATAVTAYIQGIATRSATFDKAINRIQKNADTHLVAQRDNDRDNAISTLFKAIKVAVTSDLDSEVEHARRLTIVSDAYKGVARMSYEAETKTLDTMVAELEGPVYAGSVAALNLQRYVARIKTANNAFKELFTTRITADALTETFDTTNLRLDLLDYLRQYATYLMAMANATNDTFFVQHLSLVNTARKYYNDQIARRRGMAQAADKKAAAGPQAN